VTATISTDNLVPLPRKSEPLHPDLVPHLVPNRFGGMMIHHPLIIDLCVDPEYCSRINRTYLYKRKAEQEYLRDHEWSRYIYLIERPYRVDALIRCRELGLRGREYWEELGAVWTDSNNIWQNRAKWRKLWYVPDEGREFVMEEEERAYFAALPDEIRVYRGCRRKNDRGWSWTTDREVAEWFADRTSARNRGSYVLTGIVKRSDILTLTCRGIASEQEIVSDRVRVARIERAKPERARPYAERLIQSKQAFTRTSNAPCGQAAPVGNNFPDGRCDDGNKRESSSTEDPLR
jgi:hypothetical protein